MYYVNIVWKNAKLSKRELLYIVSLLENIKRVSAT